MLALGIAHNISGIDNSKFYFNCLNLTILASDLYCFSATVTNVTMTINDLNI